MKMTFKPFGQDVIRGRKKKSSVIIIHYGAKDGKTVVQGSNVKSDWGSALKFVISLKIRQAGRVTREGVEKYVRELTGKEPTGLWPAKRESKRVRSAAYGSLSQMEKWAEMEDDSVEGGDMQSIKRSKKDAGKEMFPEQRLDGEKGSSSSSSSISSSSRNTHSKSEDSSEGNMIDNDNSGESREAEGKTQKKRSNKGHGTALAEKWEEEMSALGAEIDPEQRTAAEVLAASIELSAMKGPKLGSMLRAQAMRVAQGVLGLERAQEVMEGLEEIKGEMDKGKNKGKRGRQSPTKRLAKDMKREAEIKGEREKAKDLRAQAAQGREAIKRLERGNINRRLSMGGMKDDRGRGQGESRFDTDRRSRDRRSESRVRKSGSRDRNRRSRDRDRRSRDGEGRSRDRNRRDRSGDMRSRSRSKARVKKEGERAKSPGKEEAPGRSL
jgi:hypothetical protein